MVAIPVPRSPEEARTQFERVQGAIEDINSQMLLLHLERQRYEQVGHMLVNIMMEGLPSE
jgi:hypothetical protein